MACLSWRFVGANGEQSVDKLFVRGCIAMGVVGANGEQSVEKFFVRGSNGRWLALLLLAPVVSSRSRSFGKGQQWERWLRFHRLEMDCSTFVGSKSEVSCSLSLSLYASLCLEATTIAAITTSLTATAIAQSLTSSAITQSLSRAAITQSLQRSPNRLEQQR